MTSERHSQMIFLKHCASAYVEAPDRNRYVQAVTDVKCLGPDTKTEGSYVQTLERSPKFRAFSRH